MHAHRSSSSWQAPVCTCLHLSVPVLQQAPPIRAYPCLSVPIRDPCPALFAASLVPCTCATCACCAHLRPCADVRARCRRLAAARCYIPTHDNETEIKSPAHSHQGQAGRWCAARPSDGNAGRSAAPPAQRIVVCGVCGDVRGPQDACMQQQTHQKVQNMGLMRSTASQQRRCK